MKRMHSRRLQTAIGIALVACVGHVAAQNSAVKPNPELESASTPANKAADRNASNVPDGEFPDPPKPRIALFVPPDYPDHEKDAGDSGDVDVSARVGSDGKLVRFDILSAPSAFDAPVRNALPQWLVVPPTCAAHPEERFELRFSMVFTADHGRFFISIRGAKFAKVISDATHADPPKVRPAKISGDVPDYPRNARRHGLHDAFVQARMRVDKDGNVTNVEIPFSYPTTYFDSATVQALEQWKFAPEPHGESWVGCTVATFTR